MAKGESVIPSESSYEIDSRGISLLLGSRAGSLRAVLVAFSQFVILSHTAESWQHDCLTSGHRAAFFFSFLRSTGLPTIGDLSKWENVGKSTLIAELLKQRRDSDAAGGAPVESVVLPGATIDGDTLQVSSCWERCSSEVKHELSSKYHKVVFNSKIPFSSVVKDCWEGQGGVVCFQL